MTAVDTNVLVRLLTGDDPGQAAAARTLFEAEPVWVAKTILLETAWVLRSLYGFSEQTVSEAFTRLLGIGSIRAEDESTVVAALALTKHGVEFAVALHVSSRPANAAFVSFDRTFVQRARKAGISRIGTPDGRPVSSQRDDPPGPM